jgi:hypothetical protein
MRAITAIPCGLLLILGSGGSDSFAGGVETVAFRNPDGGKVAATFVWGD